MVHLAASVGLGDDEECAPDVDPATFGGRYQRAVRNSITGDEISCPPGQFGLIVRVVQVQRFSELGGLGTGAPKFIGNDVHPNQARP